MNDDYASLRVSAYLRTSKKSYETVHVSVRSFFSTIEQIWGMVLLNPDTTHSILIQIPLHYWFYPSRLTGLTPAFIFLLLTTIFLLLETLGVAMKTEEIQEVILVSYVLS